MKSSDLELWLAGYLAGWERGEHAQAAPDPVVIVFDAGGHARAVDQLTARAEWDAAAAVPWLTDDLGQLAAEERQRE